LKKFSELKESEKIILSYLENLDKENKLEEVNPSICKIANKTGYKYGTVCNAISNLKKYGMIQATRQRNERNRLHTCLYKVL
jgi:DNA-binding MarR family transcriptional regulator